MTCIHGGEAWFPVTIATNSRADGQSTLQSGINSLRWKSPLIMHFGTTVSLRIRGRTPRGTLEPPGPSVLGKGATADGKTRGAATR